MKRRIALRQHKVPFVHDKVIEEHAQLLLDEWAQDHPAVTKPPVPIEIIAEGHLGLPCVLVDLRGKYGQPDILGCILFGDPTIQVDQSLDTAKNPKLLGRYRFTIAHEVGHWRLHRELLLKDPSAASLFVMNAEPAFVNRSSQNPREEIQANAFAACVLMPRHLVRCAWSRWRGSDQPAAISELPGVNDQSIPTGNEDMAMDRFCKPLADQFEVSAEAMRYRLKDLGLLVREITPTLF